MIMWSVLRMCSVGLSGGAKTVGKPIRASKKRSADAADSATRLPHEDNADDYDGAEDGSAADDGDATSGSDESEFDEAPTRRAKRGRGASKATTSITARSGTSVSARGKRGGASRGRGKKVVVVGSDGIAKLVPIGEADAPMPATVTATDSSIEGLCDSIDYEAGKSAVDSQGGDDGGAAVGSTADDSTADNNGEMKAEIVVRPARGPGSRGGRGGYKAKQAARAAAEAAAQLALENGEAPPRPLTGKGSRGGRGGYKAKQAARAAAAGIVLAPDSSPSVLQKPSLTPSSSVTPLAAAATAVLDSLRFDTAAACLSRPCDADMAAFHDLLRLWGWPMYGAPDMVFADGKIICDSGAPLFALDIIACTPVNDGNATQFSVVCAPHRPDDVLHAPLAPVEPRLNAIQFWTVEFPTPLVAVKGRPTLDSKRDPCGAFTMMGLYNTGLITRLRWNQAVPADHASADDSRLGVFAALHGDGVVRVYAVPQLTDELISEYRSEDDGYAVVNMAPAAVVRAGDAKVTCFDWAGSDARLMLTGHSDGECARVCVMGAD